MTKQELIDTLYDFLLGLIPLKASAVLIIDEAQNLPLQVLEQIRILSNLETDKEKLLQIILVGQLNLQPLLRSPELRQLDQRVSIRYELKPLDSDGVAAYVAHRLTIAGGGASVGFTAKALDQVHRLSGGIPRLINLICDRALLAGFSVRAARILPDMVKHAAESLDLAPARPAGLRWLKARASLLLGVGVVLLASALAVGATALVYQRFERATARAITLPPAVAAAVPAASAATASRPAPIATAPPAAVRTGARALPTTAAMTILVGSYPEADPDRSASETEVRALTDWLEASGFPVYYCDVDLGTRGRWRRVLAGAYTDPDVARADAERLAVAPEGADARLVSAAFATGQTFAAPDPGARRSGTEP